MRHIFHLFLRFGIKQINALLRRSWQTTESIPCLGFFKSILPGQGSGFGVKHFHGIFFNSLGFSNAILHIFILANLGSNLCAIHHFLMPMAGTVLLSPAALHSLAAYRRGDRDYSHQGPPPTVLSCSFSSTVAMVSPHRDTETTSSL